MKKIIDLLEKNSGIKILISFIFIILFSLLYSLTKNKIFLWLILISGSYLILFFLISIIYAWIIYPISKIRKKNESEKD